MKGNVVGVVSLGCSKNRVDTEHMLTLLKGAGFSFTPQPEQADILIVNTCGFIQSAKEESIEQILAMAQYKTAGRCHTLAVTGCLSQRYREELLQEMPEVDIFLGVREYETLPALLAERLGAKAMPGCESGPGRVLTTPDYMAYLRISDGCDNRCSYCAIPLIRGGYTERPMEEVLLEARALAAQGVQELCVVAQDTTRYGAHSGKGLGALLRGLNGVDGLRWIRVLYAYPAGLAPEVLSALMECEKVVHYLDLPIQHANDELLLHMNRRGGKAAIRRAVHALREFDKRYILRTTVMVGFPGETQAHFDELLTFLKEMSFDRVGAFVYSPEEGTAAAAMAGQVEQSEAKARLETLMGVQKEISAARQLMRTGSDVDVLVEGVQGELYFGRSYAEAPEVDGRVHFHGDTAYAPGQWARVRLTRLDAYDSWGVAL